jgi:hypothetical protein
VAKTSPKARKAKSKPSNVTIWKGIVAKAWKDKAFKQRLVDDPSGVLAEHGFKVKKGKAYKVVADSKTTKHLILPESAKSLKVKAVKGAEPDPGF